MLRFDLPGIDPDSIEVTVDRGVLSVSATRDEKYGEDEQLFIRERAMGTFTRRVYLSDHLDTGAIEAAYNQRRPRGAHPRGGEGQAPQDRDPAGGHHGARARSTSTRSAAEPRADPAAGRHGLAGERMFTGQALSSEKAGRE